jgi:hypothetical protein
MAPYPCDLHFNSPLPLSLIRAPVIMQLIGIARPCAPTHGLVCRAIGAFEFT